MIGEEFLGIILTTQISIDVIIYAKKYIKHNYIIIKHVWWLLTVISVLIPPTTKQKTWYFQIYFENLVLFIQLLLCLGIKNSNALFFLNNNLTFNKRSIVH